MSEALLIAAVVVLSVIIGPTCTSTRVADSMSVCLAVGPAGQDRSVSGWMSFYPLQPPISKPKVSMVTL